MSSKENEHREWIFAAVDSRGEPRFVFPQRNVEWKQAYEDIHKTVSFVVELEPPEKIIILEFYSFCIAKTFYQYVDSRPSPFDSL